MRWRCLSKPVADRGQSPVLDPAQRDVTAPVNILQFSPGDTAGPGPDHDPLLLIAGEHPAEAFIKPVDGRRAW